MPSLASALQVGEAEQARTPILRGLQLTILTKTTIQTRLIVDSRSEIETSSPRLLQGLINGSGHSVVPVVLSGVTL